jgi:hypothetical protein
MGCWEYLDSKLPGLSLTCFSAINARFACGVQQREGLHVQTQANDMYIYPAISFPSHELTNIQGSFAKSNQDFLVPSSFRPFFHAVICQFESPELLLSLAPGPQ